MNRFFTHRKQTSGQPARGNLRCLKAARRDLSGWTICVAKAAGKDERFANVEEATLVPSSGSSIEQTADGSVIGTPAYMSPEQAAGRLDQLGPATDVYSLGATLYHVLTGRSPFAKLPLPELLQRVQSGKFPRPREVSSHIPKPLEAICLKAMAVDLQRRYATTTEIAEELERWLADEPIAAFPDSFLAGIRRELEIPAVR